MKTSAAKSTGNRGRSTANGPFRGTSARASKDNFVDNRPEVIQTKGIRGGDRKSFFAPQAKTSGLIQRVWKENASGKTYWEGVWPKARLMCKQPDDSFDLEGYKPPKLLFWNQQEKKYEASSSNFRMEFSTTDKFKEDKGREYNEILFWREFANMEGLRESHHILTQIIDTIHGADSENKEQVLLAHSGSALLGISIYSARSTTLGAPKIPDTVDNWLYVSYSAANPLSQIPRDRRGGVFGGAGSALNKHFDFLAAHYKIPVYQHAENPISYLSLIRAGYTDVYAAEDSFEVPG